MAEDGSSAVPGLTIDSTLLTCCVCSNMLLDPLLLSCLHSCCRKCAQETTATGGLTCPLCNRTTMTADQKPNVFLRCRLRALNDCREPKLCEACEANEGDECAEPASYWCPECVAFLCSNCLRWHRKFYCQHAVVTAATIDAPHSQQLCHRHGRPYETFCISCSALCCSECAPSCMEAKHDMADVAGARVEGIAQKAAQDVRAALRELDDRSPVVTKVLELASDLEATRTNDMSLLEANKMQLLDAVSGARQRAEAALCSLSRHSVEPGLTWELLHRRAEYAMAYVRRLLDSRDAVSLLDQHKLLVARLSALAEVISGHLPSQVGSGDALAFLPEREQERSMFEDAVEKWIGHPRQLTGDFATDICRDGTDVDAQSLVVALPTEMPAAHGSGNSVVQEARDTQGAATKCLPDDHDSGKRVHLFGDVRDSFRAPFDCRDLAITSDGRVMIAALRQGLKQYETSGRKLKTWYPPATVGGQSGIVSTVDVVDDGGRLAVGVINLSCVLILERTVPTSDSYHEVQRIEPQLDPYRLAVHTAGCLLAVSGAYSDQTNASLSISYTWMPGPHLVILSLSNRGVLLKRSFAYSILSLAVTARAVITLSNEKRATAIAGLSAIIVEACDHQGELLWRREIHEDVYDVCCLPAGHVLYLALPHSVRVIAISEADGNALKDVLTAQTHAFLNPLRLSISSGQQPLLAVMSVKGIVMIYPAVGFA